MREAGVALGSPVRGPGAIQLKDPRTAREKKAIAAVKHAWDDYWALADSTRVVVLSSLALDGR